MINSSRIFLKRTLRQCFHTSEARCIDPKNVEEVRVPVPWGHIAGKWWGSKDVQPILGVHGWQDNGGTWDPLATLLPPDYSLLAIDLPGNGLSSHLPPLHNYYFSDSVAVLRRIKRHFGFDQLDLLGHSGGSSSCFLYSCMFPEDVKTYFGIDFLVFCYGNEGKRVEMAAGFIDQKIELGLRDHKSSRRYTWEDAKKLWKQATKDSLNDQSAEILMKRGLTKMDDGLFIFSRDQRLKAPDLNVLNAEQVYKIASNIRCDLRLVKGLQSKYFNFGIKYCPDVLNILEKNAKSYHLYSLEGNHHLHLDIPEKVTPLLLELLKSS